jgi:hypothetical protein
MSFQAKKKPSKFSAKPFVEIARTGSRARKNNALAEIKLRPRRREAAAPSLNRRAITASCSPVHRRYHSKFFMPRKSQIAILDFPELRWQSKWQRRLWVVTVAKALTQGKFCSLNAAARILGVPASSLCVQLQRFNSSGEAGLRPARCTTSTATVCRLSVYLRP